MTVAEHLADYVADHTSCSESRWHKVGTDQRGPFPISSISKVVGQGIELTPTRDTFLNLIRSHMVGSDCNPLDGETHGFDELSRWFQSGGIVLPFVGLGVILGVFELVGPWREQEARPYDDLMTFLQDHGGGLFKAKLNDQRQVPVKGT
jgi:hypothetical protein